MRPYIEETKEFINSTYNALELNPLAEDLSLGVVAYRNSTRYNQKLEYVSRIIAPLTPVSGRQIMERGLAGLDEAKVSTHAFNEDAFAGIMSAIEGLDWKPYAIKLAVLITDAGAIRNDDKYSSTGLNEEEIRDLLAQKGIRLLVVHLQTASGKRHGLDKTEKQYRTLTSVKDASLKSVYLSLPAYDSKTGEPGIRQVIEGNGKHHPENHETERRRSARPKTGTHRGKDSRRKNFPDSTMHRVCRPT